MNIRDICGLDPSYAEISREERNTAAIFFAALIKPGNTERFLELLGIDETPGNDFGIYFEYAYLRDLWNRITDEETKKEIIRRLCPVNNIDAVLSGFAQEINHHFGASKESATYIQQPGWWAISKYDRTIANNDDFLKICRFKWSFNIKPDIVIHLDKSRAICIEAKVESDEGQYPSSERDKAIFHRRGIPYVGQMELQKYMMEELLGVETRFLFLVKKKSKSETHQVITWREVFDCLDISDLPPFAQTMICNVS